MGIEHRHLEEGKKKWKAFSGMVGCQSLHKCLLPGEGTNSVRGGSGGMVWLVQASNSLQYHWPCRPEGAGLGWGMLPCHVMTWPPVRSWQGTGPGGHWTACLCTSPAHPPPSTSTTALLHRGDGWRQVHMHMHPILSKLNVDENMLAECFCFPFNHNI